MKLLFIMLCVMVSIDCQHDGIQDHPGDTSLGIPVRDYLCFLKIIETRLFETERSTLTVDVTISPGWGSWAE